MKNLILLIIFLCTASFAQAQYEAAFNHYHVSPILINPSVAGFQDVHQLQMNLRNHWTGFPNNPKTYAVSYNGPIGKTLGLGVGILSESIAQITRYRFQLNYAFRYEIKDVKFAAGFSTEFQNLRIANSVLDNRLTDAGDILILDAVETNSYFDASVGLYARIKDATFIGITLPNLIRAKLDDIAGAQEQTSSQYLIFHIGNEFDLETYNVKIEPSLLIRRIRDVPLQIDFNVIGKFLDDRFNAGLSYHAGAGGAVSVLLGTKVSTINIFYSYQVSFQQSQQYHSGSHEITVAFGFGEKEQRFNRNSNYRN